MAKAFRLALAAHKNLPDAIQLNYTEVPEFAQAGVLRDLSDVFAPVKNDLYAGALQIAQYNGKFVAFPFEVKSKLYLLSRRHLRAGRHLAADDGDARRLHPRGPEAARQVPQELSDQRGPATGPVLDGRTPLRLRQRAHGRLIGQLPGRLEQGVLRYFHLLPAHTRAPEIAWPVDDFSTDWAQGFKNGIIASDLLASWMKFFLPGYATRRRQANGTRRPGPHWRPWPIRSSAPRPAARSG